MTAAAILRAGTNRLGVVLATLLLVSFLVFGLQLLLPGDPALAIAGEDRSPEAIAFIRAKYGLDDPLPAQYLRWLGQVLRGDLGTSLRTDLPVGGLIAGKLPVTLQLAAMSMLVALGLGLPLGVLAAWRAGGWLDTALNALAVTRLSVANFWLGIVLILLVSVHWGILPASGYVSPREDLRANLEAMLMPSLVLGTGLAAVVLRHTRAAMMEVLSSDYIRTARAGGLRERAVVLRHGLRNALAPVLTLSALQLGELLAGAVLTEQVFGIPGFGKLIVDGVFTRDYAVVQGVVLCTATGFILLNLLADGAQALLNPRLRGPRA